MANPNVAETLRAIANEEAYAGDLIVESTHKTDGDDVFLKRRRTRQAACDSGARAWEIVQRLAEENPWIPVAELSQSCFFCGGNRYHGLYTGKQWQETHTANCLWQQARSLTGQEECKT